MLEEFGIQVDYFGRAFLCWACKLQQIKPTCAYEGRCARAALSLQTCRKLCVYATACVDRGWCEAFNKPVIVMEEVSLDEL